MSITAVPDYDDLVVDYTLDPSGVSGSFVPQSFVIQGTLPVRINGGASADQSTSPLTISTNQFGAADAGIVPLSGGGTSNFLRADGTWATPAGSGGYTTIQEEGVDLTQRGKINFVSADITVADDAGGSKTQVSLPRFGSANGGTVSGSGGGTSNFLRADGTWSTPGLPGGVTLQSVTPGVADVGHVHVDGVAIADTRLVAGPITTPIGNAPLESYPSTGDGAYIRAAGASAFPNIYQQRARGTQAAPTGTLDNDDLGGFFATGYSSVGGWAGSISSGIFVKADGNASASRQPSYMDGLAGDINSFSQTRLSSSGLRIQSGMSSISNSVRALHTADVQGTFGIKTKTVTSSGGGLYNYTQLVGDPSILLLEATVADMNVGLLSAATIAGRICTFISVGTGGKYIVLTPNGAEKINGQATFYFQRKGDAVSIISDGTNWWTIERPDSGDLSSKATDGTVVANTAVATNLFANIGVPVQLILGATFRIRVQGKYSTTGTPTLRLRVLNTSSSTMADSGAVTCATVTDAPFHVECESILTNTSTYLGRLVRAALHLTNASGVTTQYNMITTFGTPANGIVPINVSAQWGAADPANSITQTSLIYTVTPETIVL